MPPRGDYVGVPDGTGGATSGAANDPRLSKFLLRALYLLAVLHFLHIDRMPNARLESCDNSAQGMTAMHFEQIRSVAAGGTGGWPPIRCLCWRLVASALDAMHRLQSQFSPSLLPDAV